MLSHERVSVKIPVLYWVSLIRLINYFPCTLWPCALMTILESGITSHALCKPHVIRVLPDMSGLVDAIESKIKNLHSSPVQDDI
jgi:hypothetical protein